MAIFFNVFSTCRGYDEHNITITIEDGSPDIVSYMDIHVHFSMHLEFVFMSSYKFLYFPYIFPIVLENFP